MAAEVTHTFLRTTTPTHATPQFQNSDIEPHSSIYKTLLFSVTEVHKLHFKI
jgi:hypothetical protein